MAETKLPRLLAAAKEFNVGQDTIIDYLAGRGFPKDDLKPTSKLSEDMYRSLQQEFSSDKAAKMKSDQLELPKGSQVEAKKKREDEEIIFKKEEKVAPKPIIKKEEEVKPVEEEKPKPKKEEPVAELPKAEVVKAEAPEIEGPKLVKKIDLSTIDSSTRPKKITKAKKEDEPAPPVEEKATTKVRGKKTKKE